MLSILRLSGSQAPKVFNHTELKSKCPSSISTLYGGFSFFSRYFSTAERKNKNLRLEKLEKVLNQKVVGQSHAIKEIVHSLHLHEAGITDGKHPIANLLFLGPTGVGKTELAKVLAQEVYGNSNSLVRFDMTKFSESFTASGLVGSTAGYVGYGEGGLLTNPVIKDPRRIFLFDELEKAHPRVQKILLSVMGSGEIRDSKGRLALFNRSIIIMTSNLCSMKIQELYQQKMNHIQIEKILRPEFMKGFSPEFYGRVNPVTFNPANKNMLKTVVTKMINDKKTMIEQKKRIYLDVDSGAIDYISKYGFSPELGFRPTEQFITQHFALPIAKLINSNEVQLGQSIQINYDFVNKQINFSVFDDYPQRSQPKFLIRQIKNQLAEGNIKSAMSTYEALVKEMDGNSDTQKKLEEHLFSPVFRNNLKHIKPDLPQFFDISLKIAKIYLKSDDEWKNPEIAFRIFNLLSELDQKEGDSQLGYMYLYGKGIKEDERKAYFHLTKAASHDDPHACFYLAEMHGNGWGNLHPNKLKAEEYFMKSAALGPANIVNRVGVVFAHGEIVSKNLKLANSYYRRAAENGDPWGHYNLAFQYLNGTIVPKHPEKGVHHLLKAGKLGVPKAYKKLGEIYEQGLYGIAKNEGFANRYLNKNKPEKKPEDTPPPSENKTLVKNTLRSVLSTWFFGKNNH